MCCTVSARPGPGSKSASTARRNWPKRGSGCSRWRAGAVDSIERRGNFENLAPCFQKIVVKNLGRVTRVDHLRPSSLFLILVPFIMAKPAATCKPSGRSQVVHGQFTFASKSNRELDANQTFPVLGLRSTFWYPYYVYPRSMNDSRANEAGNWPLLKGDS